MSQSSVVYVPLQACCGDVYTFRPRFAPEYIQCHVMRGATASPRKYFKVRVLKTMHALLHAGTAVLLSTLAHRAPAWCYDVFQLLLQPLNAEFKKPQSKNVAPIPRDEIPPALSNSPHVDQAPPVIPPAPCVSVVRIDTCVHQFSGFRNSTFAMK